jgi:hypothetical protein
MNTITSLITAAVVTTSLHCGDARADLNDWYMQQLFEPSKTQLAMEGRGRVMIYKGLRDTDVQRALDEKFGRIESMLFTSTVVTDEDGETVRDEKAGEVLVENDGC